MPHRPRLQCPNLDFLDDVERTFGVVWPEPFRSFCRVNARSELNSRYPGLTGTFICDFERLEKINALVGEGSWGDYEQAVAGVRRVKDGRRLYMDLLPFYVRGRDVYGFLTDELPSDKVAVWAVHTIVHDYPSFEVWLSREGLASRSKKKPR
jgi:hypothetical protein